MRLEIYIWKTNCFRSKKLDFQINNCSKKINNCSKSIYSSCQKLTSLLAKNNNISLIIYLQYRKTIRRPPSSFSLLLGPRLPPTSDHRFPKKENRKRERSRLYSGCSQNCLHLNTGREIAENSDFLTLSRNWNLMIVHVNYLVNFQKLLWWLQRVCVCGHGLVCLFSKYPWTQRST